MPLKKKKRDSSVIGLKSLPRLPLKRAISTPRPKLLEEECIGPAFWNTPFSSQPRNFLPPQIHPLWDRKERQVPGPPKYLGIASWWQLSTLILIVTAVLLFLYLISLFLICIRETDAINADLPSLQRWQKRLQYAVNYESKGTVIHCKTCKDHWMQRADHCYLHTSETMTWNGCRDHCRTLESHLFIAKTDGEMESLIMYTSEWFVLQNSKPLHGKYWIGLIYNVSWKSWHWEDGTFMHLPLPNVAKMIYPYMDVCTVFGSGRVFLEDCTQVNHCLCQRTII